MKKIALSLALCAVAGLSARLAATTFTVNNNNPSPGQYSTIDAAIGAAAAGDTILIAGSPNNYGYFTVNKNNLTLIGAGHKPQTQPGFATVITDIIFVANLDSFKIQGFDLNSLNNSSVGNVDHVTMEFCLIRSLVHVSVDCNNWVIKNCVFTCNNCCAIDGTGSGNILVANNIFVRNPVICNSGVNGGIVINNNVFLLGGSGSSVIFYYLSNATISNNIFYGSPAYGSNISNCIFNNNLSFMASDNALPPLACTNCSGSGNIVNQDPLFSNYDGGGTLSYNYDFTLQASSPGKNAGADGTDLGVYGANNTFSETGEPPIPVVRTLTIANPSTAQGALLNVNVTISNPDPDQ